MGQRWQQRQPSALEQELALCLWRPVAGGDKGEKKRQREERQGYPETEEREREKGGEEKRGKRRDRHTERETKRG